MLWMGEKNFLTNRINYRRPKIQDSKNLEELQLRIKDSIKRYKEITKFYSTDL